MEKCGECFCVVDGDVDGVVGNDDEDGGVGDEDDVVDDVDVIVGDEDGDESILKGEGSGRRTISGSSCVGC